MTSCRCCNSSVDLGLCKDLFLKNLSFGKEEIYSAMIQECFGILLSPSINNKICQKCIRDLQIAFEFREQLLLSERALLITLKEAEDKTHMTLKNEVNLEARNGSFLKDTLLKEELEELNDVNYTEKFSIKTEQRSVSPFIEETKNFQSNTCVQGKSRQTKFAKKRPHKKKSEKHPSKFKSGQSKGNEKNKHKQNLYTILNYSNAVPFKNKTVFGYICSYCDKPFPDPADLRLHTEKQHVRDRLDIYKSVTNRVPTDSLMIKLDITNLRCTICQKEMPNLDNLKEHLINVHQKTFHKVKDLFVQFKLLAGQKYDCALCPSTYETYKMLLQHMNTHCRNYVCDECGTPFITKARLRVHETTHMNGHFECSHCDKVFPSRGKRRGHESVNHKSKEPKRCPHCEELFPNYYQRNQHVVKAHNEDMLYKCNVCDRRFLLKRILVMHVKRHHLLERNFQCNECAWAFFTKKELETHMVKHTGEKTFECKVCRKSYGRQKTLREHMRIHDNDRRHKCEVCSMTFVQKCSLKSHLLTNHKIVLNSAVIK